MTRDLLSLLIRDRYVAWKKCCKGVMYEPSCTRAWIVPTFLYLRTLWFRFCYMFSVQVCVCPSFGRCWPSLPNVPAIDPGCLLAVFIFDGRFYFMLFFSIYFFFLHYGNNYHYCSNMFQDISCYMRPVKGGFTFSSAQTNVTFVKCKLAVIIDENRSLLSCAPKLSFHFPT